MKITNQSSKLSNHNSVPIYVPMKTVLCYHIFVFIYIFYGTNIPVVWRLEVDYSLHNSNTCIYLLQRFQFFWEWHWFLFLANVTVALIHMQKVLVDAGYLPTNYNEYPLEGIIATIEEAFGASPLLVCKHGAVEELRLCLYKNFTVRLDSAFLWNTQDWCIPRYIAQTCFVIYPICVIFNLMLTAVASFMLCSASGLPNWL